MRDTTDREALWHRLELSQRRLRRQVLLFGIALCALICALLARVWVGHGVGTLLLLPAAALAGGAGVGSVMVVIDLLRDRR